MVNERSWVHSTVGGGAGLLTRRSAGMVPLPNLIGVLVDREQSRLSGPQRLSVKLQFLFYRVRKENVLDDPIRQNSGFLIRRGRRRTFDLRDYTQVENRG